ncbi:MAG: cell division protein ZapA [Pseudomonadaceae bacterium]|nr:cell division protein ZapA [Pseudomonadaceae bacterium]
MSNMVDVTLGGRSYRLSVAAGQETKVKSLATHVDALLSDLRSADPLMDRDRQLVLACIQLAAESLEARDQLDEQGASVVQFHRALALKLEQLLPQ